MSQIIKKKHSKATVSSRYEAPSIKKINHHTAGIDIGANSIFVCAPDDEGYQQVREYPTFTADLKAMASWLKECGVKSVAMESTGVYWIPTFEILEAAGFEVVLVNAYYLKCVPSHKSDVQDCQWIQECHSCGMLKGSFRPADSIIPLRAFTRLRARLFESAAQQVNLMHKALTQMNIQLNMVISDITGYTGMSIIRAILAGERDHMKLAAMRDRRCKKSLEEIAKALEGNYRPEHILALKMHVESYDLTHRQIEECENYIQEELKNLPQLPPPELPLTNEVDEKDFESTLENKSGLQEKFQEETSKKVKSTSRKKESFNRSPYIFDINDALKEKLSIDLTEIPGIDGSTAVKILAEIGTDMSRWKSEKHFSSWLGLCPNNKISGGKILSRRTKPSNNRAAQALRMGASTLWRSDTALGAFHRRKRALLGPAKAVTATAHKMAKIIYRMLKNRCSYRELGAEYYEEQHKKRVVKNLERKAKDLGYDLVPKVA